MAIELMRWIDYWLGVPVCFLLTGISYILKLVTFRKKENIVPRKFLFIKLSEMGSIILAYPLMDKVRKDYPQAKIFFLTFKSNKPIFEILNIVHHENILTIREKSPLLFILDTLRAMRRIRTERIDIAFDLEFFSRFTAILTYLSGAFKKVGFYRYSFEGLYRGNLLTHKVQCNPLIHVSKLFMSLQQVIKPIRKVTPELEKKIPDEEIVLPSFVSSKEAKKQMWNNLMRLGVVEKAELFLINPGEGRLPQREWPVENFVCLGRKLLENSKNYIIIVGTDGDSRNAELLCKLMDNERCLDLTNKTTISEMLDLCGIAKALIANDSGLAHLASLTSIKKFILFGPETPQVFSPLGGNTKIICSNLPCSPCLSAFNHRKSACRDNKCLKVIKPDEIYEMIKKCP
ncbi:MAG: glycosyltransferase family 9 protein [Candidatus Omnitrophota bacterium]